MSSIAPIKKQPKSNAWKIKPAAVEGLHPGLEHLQGLDSIFMKQRIDTLELFTGWQVQNKWKLSDPVTGDLIAAFKEDSECCQRQCCKNARAFKADISDSQGNVLFKMDRPFHCQCICCADACDGFCGQELTTLTSNNLVISRAVQESDCACPCWLDWKLAIYDESGHLKYRLENNICKATCCDVCYDKKLYLNDANGDQVGLVTKLHRGFCVECCTPADNIHIQFPHDATASDKAGIISAVMLTDYNIWELQSKGE